MDALACNLEVHYQLTSERRLSGDVVPGTGEILSPGLLARGLRYYACRQQDIELAELALQSIAVTVSQGGVSRAPAREVTRPLPNG